MEGAALSDADSHSRLVRALYRIGRALARIVIRHGLSAKDVYGILKKAFVDVAREDYGLNGRPTNKARVAALTGLTRVEVARLIDAPRPGSGDYASQHPLRRLVEHWLHRAPWASVSGEPLALPVSGAPNSFEALVAGAGGDIAWQTLLKELLRMGIARREGDWVSLTQHGFVPVGGDLESLNFMGEDVASLLSTFDWNLHDGAEQPRFQRAATFVRLDEAGWEALTALAQTEGQALLERTHKALTPHQQDDDKGRSGMTGMGLYIYRVDSLDGDDQ